MYFVGIDLAWSKKESNKTGIAISEGNKKEGKLCYYGNLTSDKEIIDKINQIIGEDNAIIAIDAPLIVPNEKGRRKAEQEISNHFGKYNAGAHSSNRSR